MKSPTSRLPALDVLRFIAAMAVVSYHYLACYLPRESLAVWLAGAAELARFGYLGVDLFFLISGFVILWSIQGRNASEFVVSRIGRLYPSFWAAMLLTTAFITFLGPSVPSLNLNPVSLGRLAANATMMPQIFDQQRIDGVYWTLEVEIRFYFLVFILLLLRQVGHVERWLYVWLAISLANAVWTLPGLVRFLSVDPYAPLFIGGCLLFAVHVKGWSIARAIGLLASIVMAMYQTTAVQAQFITPDALSAIVVPLLVLSCFVIFYIALKLKGNGLYARIAYRLGALTYPLYLIHAMIGKIMLGYLLPKLGAPMALTITVLFILVLAQALVVAVDEPARKPLIKLCNGALNWARVAVRSHRTTS